MALSSRRVFAESAVLANVSSEAAVRSMARHSNLGGLAPEVARAQQESIHGLERMRLQQQSELVQQKARQQRHRLEQESMKLRTDIRDHKFVARERVFETGQATRMERELIRSTPLAPQLNLTSPNKSQRAPNLSRRERASVASERASFDHAVRRREAAFRSYEVEACVENKASVAGQPEDVYQLAEAIGRPELDLALAGRAGGRITRSLWAAVFHTG